MFLEDFPTFGFVKQGLIGIKVLLETTFELNTKESHNESSLHLIYSSTSLSMDVENELVWFASCPHVSRMISSITQLFEGPEFRIYTQCHLCYVGVRKIDSGPKISEAKISWNWDM